MATHGASRQGAGRPPFGHDRSSVLRRGHRGRGRTCRRQLFAIMSPAAHCPASPHGSSGCAGAPRIDPGRGSCDGVEVRLGVQRVWVARRETAGSLWRSSLMRRLIGAFSVAAVLVGAGFTATATAKPFPEMITLPGATSAEGIATGIGSSFFAGIYSWATSTAATSAQARPRCSSTRPPAGWRWV